MQFAPECPPGRAALPAPAGREGLPGEWPSGYEDASAPHTPAWHKTMTPGAAGASGAAGDAADSGLRLLSPGGAGLNGSLLKLNANGFLQRAQRAQFFRSHQRQRAPG